MIMSDLNKIVFIPDIHFPHQDDDALALVEFVIKDLQPTKVVFMGDLLDLAQLSRFDKDVRIDTLQHEIDLAVDYMTRIRKAVPKADIYLKLGNHDERLPRYLMNKAPELQGLDCLKIENVLKLDTLNIKFYREYERFFLGDLFITHGWYVRPKSGYAGHASLVNSGPYNGISVHTHKLAKVYSTTLDGNSKYWIEAGYLGTTDYLAWRYNKDKNIDWQQGFAVATISKEGYISAEPVHINDGSCVVFGKQYEV